MSPGPQRPGTPMMSPAFNTQVLMSPEGFGE